MEKQFKQREWDRLLSQIEERKVVPVIGPEVLCLNIDGKDMLLYQYLAEELAGRLGVDTLPDNSTINDVSCGYLRQQGEEEDICYELKDILNSRTWSTPDPLKKIAEITHFDLYLSTTFDGLLKQALDEIRYGGKSKTKSLSYSNMGQVADIPQDFEKLREPLIYQLFGQVSAVRDFVVTEEDLLLFNRRLLSRDFQPHNLMDLLKARRLLQIGCSFPNWLARFFLCAAKGDQVFVSQGISGTVADEESSGDASLFGFLERQKISVYQGGNALAFIDELYKQWKNRFGNMVPCSNSDNNDEKEENTDVVFISYASEDRDTVVNLKRSLESIGIDVWFDKDPGRLESGVSYEDKIIKAIKNCSYFIPVISNHTQTRKSRFFWLEWNKAIKEAEMRPEIPFILPVAIDDVHQDLPVIPEKFRELQWEWFENGHPKEDWLRLMRKRIRDLRREKRDKS